MAIHGVECRMRVITIDVDLNDTEVFRDRKGVITFKQGSGLKREEVEIPVNFSKYCEFMNAFAPTDTTMIEKTTHVYNIDGHVVEVSVVKDELTYAEVEFSTEQEAMDFVPFPWMGKEVTGDPFYKMQAVWERHLKRS